MEKEPEWFVQWKNNDFAHLVKRCIQLEKKSDTLQVTASFNTKLIFILLGSTVGGALSIIYFLLTRSV